MGADIITTVVDVMVGAVLFGMVKHAVLIEGRQYSIILLFLPSPVHVKDRMLLKSSRLNHLLHPICIGIIVRIGCSAGCFVNFILRENGQRLGVYERFIL